MKTGRNYKFWFCTGSQSSSAFASLNVLRISSFVISVGFHTNSNGRTPLLFNSSTMILECSARKRNHNDSSSAGKAGRNGSRAYT